MQKILTWIKEVKKANWLWAALVIVGLYLLYTIRQAMLTDNSLALAKQELRLKQENYDLMQKQLDYQQKNEQQLKGIILGLNDNIRAMISRDSIIQQHIASVDVQMSQLSTKYNEKVKIINAMGSDELRRSFGELSPLPDNDY